MISTSDIEEPGLVLEDDEVVAHAAQVNHPPFTHALAYRIDTASGSVVVSGDTTPCDELIALAEGADVLIHEVVHPLAIDRYQHDTNAARRRSSAAPEVGPRLRTACRRAR